MIQPCTRLNPRLNWWLGRGCLWPRCFLVVSNGFLPQKLEDLAPGLLNFIFKESVVPLGEILLPALAMERQRNFGLGPQTLTSITKNVQLLSVQSCLGHVIKQLQASLWQPRCSSNSRQCKRVSCSCLFQGPCNKSLDAILACSNWTVTGTVHQILHIAKICSRAALTLFFSFLPMSFSNLLSYFLLSLSMHPFFFFFEGGFYFFAWFFR